MPKKAKSLSINLLPGREPTFAEKFLQWSLTFGRYIIIGTEIIVLLAFLSRFKLDRDFIDLNDKVKEKQRILASLSTIESNVRSLQTRIGEIKTADSAQGSGIVALPHIASLTPPTVTYKDIRAEKDKLIIIGLASQTQQISQFVANMKESNVFRKETINLESVERGKEEGDLIRFTISAQSLKKAEK